MAQGYGGLVGLKLGGEHVVLVTDKGLARQVLVSQADDFVKASSHLACLPIFHHMLCLGEHTVSCS